MAFTTDFSEVQEFKSFEEKFYEFIVKDAYEEPTQSGTNHSLYYLFIRICIQKMMIFQNMLLM
jgi:hypothetical protein